MDLRDASVLSRDNKLVEECIKDLVEFDVNVEYNRAPIDHWINLWRGSSEFRKFILKKEELRDLKDIEDYENNCKKQASENIKNFIRKRRPLIQLPTTKMRLFIEF